MAAADDLPYDLTPPNRPTLADLGGADHEDDPEFAPDPVTMPNAAAANVQTKLLAACARLQPVASLWIRIISGSPSKHAGQFASSTVDLGDFSLTDETAGRVRVEWAANTFPAPLGEPVATPFYTTDANNPALQAVAAQTESITNGCRVRTYRCSTDGLIDYNFRLDIY